MREYIIYECLHSLDMSEKWPVTVWLCCRDGIFHITPNSGTNMYVPGTCMVYFHSIRSNTKSAKDELQGPLRHT